MLGESFSSSLQRSLIFIQHLIVVMLLGTCFWLTEQGKVLHMEALPNFLGPQEYQISIPSITRENSNFHFSSVLHHKPFNVSGLSLVLDSELIRVLHKDGLQGSYIPFSGSIGRFTWRVYIPHWQLKDLNKRKKERL